ncbi:hypothetical protein [Magnetospirillum aberrantis]|uniref:Uncharacterized protein n=1 Tax=Magnetospirillum aberrantis SpK TaxID=908842 RepID=A0A7C9UXA4_9PROT|nr:hypothetical protein [Magnetospirillum aberrantis]NFV78991.1 hypothetical protein [Magnetospirillum aberrantis SpK]
MRTIIVATACCLITSAALAQEDAARALLDAHEMDTGLPLSTETIEGWRIEEVCRPHLCHLHKRLTVTAPDGAAMVLVFAPSEVDGKPAVVGMRGRGWDDGKVPQAVRGRIAEFGNQR